MKNFIIIVFVFILLPRFIYAGVTEKSWIIESNQASKLIKPCSRSGPENVDGYWTPVRKEIEKIQVSFPKSVDGKLLKPISDYYLQYAGFTRRGNRVIYISGFRIDRLSEFHVDPTRKMLKKPMRFCDGGEGFFGLEYDVESGTFSHLEFNSEN